MVLVLLGLGRLPRFRVEAEDVVSILGKGSSIASTINPGADSVCTVIAFRQRRQRTRFPAWAALALKALPQWGHLISNGPFSRIQDV